VRRGKVRPTRKRVTDKTRASDDELREKLDKFDVRVLDRALEKAIKPAPRSR
jgi:hypothetical protein